MKANLGLTENQTNPVVEILNHLLSDEHVLTLKTRNYHWNVTGPHFSELHKFFEAQYGELDAILDEVAERARSLGGKPVATMQEFLKLARLKEVITTPKDARAMIASLLADHESVIVSLRAAVEVVSDKHKDAGTGDFLTGLMEQHEKMAWMLRSYLE